MLNGIVQRGFVPGGLERYTEALVTECLFDLFGEIFRPDIAGDIYADLEKIEKRGKRKKSGGRFFKRRKGQ